jgi:UDP-N-acetylmuramoyl-tripeptide--D-alanyl-D-alanine ligase
MVAEGPGGLSFPGISIDTRTLQPGELFFAIRGPNNDGHQFIPAALSRGAAGVVAASGYSHPEVFPSGKVLVKVSDTHRALRDLAAAVRRRWRGTSIGLTGSMGKTTTKEFAAQVLESACTVYRSPGNYNNLFGLPLAVCGLRLDDAAGVFEMGMSEPGEISEMCRIAAPSFGIITNVAPVHLEFFSSIDGIAAAKAELAEALPLNGTLIYNSDNALVRKIAGRFGGGKVAFGLEPGADFRADEIEITGLNQTRFRLRYGSVDTTAAIPLAGTHYVLNALAAIALGHQFGIDSGTLVASLKHLRAASMRGGILHFREGFSVIDDSYNSNPEALKSMTEVLARLPGFRRRILVAGEMLELGSDSGSLHRDCGAYAAGARLDGILGVRGDARQIVRAAVDSGMSEANARFFTDTAEAAEYLKGNMRRGDLVLIKGSRGAHMEKIVQDLCSVFEFES